MRLVGPVSLDATPLEVAISPTGQAAVAIGFVDPEQPSGARASLAILPPAGQPLRVRPVPHTRQVLDLAYLGGTLALLGGASGGGLACCTEVQTLTLGPHGFSARQPLIRGLAGVITGRLLPSGSGALAVFASNSGVWAARAARVGRFGPPRRLTNAGAGPQSFVATTLHGGGPLVAFAQAPFVVGAAPTPPSVLISSGASPGLPPRPRAVQTFPAGTSIGPLALAPNPSSPTLGWTQDTSDATGLTTSAVALTALGTTPATRMFGVPGQIASALTGAGDSSGDELFAWESCDAAPVCQVLAASRQPGGRFGTARTLGRIDAAAEPAVAVGAHGGAAVAWVQSGHVMVARRTSASQRFAAPARLPGPGPASGLRLAAGPGGRMLAVWVAGTTRSTVWASQLR